MRANTDRNVPLLRASLTWMKGVTDASCFDLKCDSFLALRRRFIQIAKNRTAHRKMSPRVPKMPPTAAFLSQKGSACGAFTDCDGPEAGCEDELDELDDCSVADGPVNVVAP